MNRLTRRVPASLAVASVLFCAAAPLSARITGEAFKGSPFGIGTVTVPLSAADSEVVATRGYQLLEKNRRAVYPVFTQGVARRIFNALLGGGGSDSTLKVMFLFKGDEPLDLTVVTSRAHEVRVEPRTIRPNIFRVRMQTWWREYNAAARQQAKEGDYPPIIETYLTTMLGARLGFKPPLFSRTGQKDSDELQQTLKLLTGAESLHYSVIRDTVLGRSGLGDVADRPVPANIAWGPPADAAADADVAIEPIAMHVPAECLYIRFGTFDNFLWYQRLGDEYGGELNRMIRLRGHDAGMNRKIERQLQLKTTKAAELFGSRVVADVAMIGRDMFMREGAAIGMLFQSKNGLFETQTRGDRRAALNKLKDQGATLKELEIAGQKVTLLSTPDNQVRSFYAVDGSFHLVTSSRAMVERFFEVGEDKDALGQSAEFRHARTLMPIARDDTIFAYISTAFLRGLVSPQYQIELSRRMQAVADIELLQLASLAAQAEGMPHEDIEDLIASGFLPRGFGVRPDGSTLTIQEDGRIFNSLRGARGSFLPIPDVELTGVTAAEEAMYARRAEYYAQNWKQMDPLMVGFKRFWLDEEKAVERLVVDANVSPFGEEKYGWITSILGPPTKERVTLAPGDIVNVQASVKGGLLLPSIPPHTLFLRIQDIAPPATDLRPTGFFKMLEILQTTPGYLGAFPKPGFLDLLPFNLGGTFADAAGFSSLPFGVQRWQGGGFSLLSFDRGILAHVAPALRPEPTKDPAQIRITVGDLSRSKLVPLINSLNYQRAYQTTMGNVRMMHALTHQLQVPREQALETAQRLLNVNLVCSLDGGYELSDASGVLLWQSTRWSDHHAHTLPADYRAPILGWFRGLDAGLSKLGDRMIVHAEIDMQRKQAESVGLTLPKFSLFGNKNKERENSKSDPKPENLPIPPAKPQPSIPRGF